MIHPEFAFITGPEVLILALVWVIPGYLLWRIATKGGYPGPVGLLFLVPFVNIIFLIAAAFLEWPVEKEVKMLRAAVKERAGY